MVVSACVGVRVSVRIDCAKLYLLRPGASAAGCSVATWARDTAALVSLRAVTVDRNSTQARCVYL